MTSLARTQCTVVVDRGCVCLVGDEVDEVGERRYKEYTAHLQHKARGKRLSVDLDAMAQARVQRDGNKYHMTIITKHEIKMAQQLLSADGVKDSVAVFANKYLGQDLFFGRDWFSLGVGTLSAGGGTPDYRHTVFDVCAYPKALTLRSRLGLRIDYGFHITLGFSHSDIHGIKRLDHIPGFFGKQHTAVELLDAAKYLLRQNNVCNSNIGILDIAYGVETLLGAAGRALEYESLNSPSQEKIVANHIRIMLTRIRLCNKTGDIGMIVHIANEVLATYNEANINPTQQREAYKLIAIVMSFKGAAMVRLEMFGDAMPILEDAYRMEEISRDFQVNNSIALSQSHENDFPKMHCRIERIKSLLKSCAKNIGKGVSTAPPKLKKFPRTRHIGDASQDVASWGSSSKKKRSAKSAVTRDDLLLESLEISEICNGRTNVTLQEKIDGANLGISIAKDGTILCQNRSKFISSSDSTQYGPLDSWLKTHFATLNMLLEPERHVLFGEWLVAKHSIPYHNLPGYFVAFDLYDAFLEKFYSVRELHRRLHMVAVKLGFSNSPLPVVPKIVSRTFSDPTELLPYLEQRSLFRSDGGKVEGVYLRVDSGKWLEKRCKLVRADFVHGIQTHWMKQKFEKNTVNYEFAMEYLKSCLEQDAFAEKADGKMHRLNPRSRITVTIKPKKHIVLMRNFSYITLNEVAGSSTPKQQQHIDALEHIGITLIITLTEEEALEERWFANKRNIRNVFVPVPNYNPPSLEQMLKIDKLVRRELLKGGQVLVHCGGGKGRAGTVLACLVLKYGCSRIRDGITKEISAEESRGAMMTSEKAMKWIRNMRPGSIETTRQEAFVRKYAKYLWKQSFADSTDYVHETNDASSQSEESFQSASDLVSELLVHPVKHSRNTKKAKKIAAKWDKRRKMAQGNVPRFIILCGFPGSGKSTFAKQMVLAGAGKFVRCNQDELGKKGCMNLIQKHAKPSNNDGKRIVVDRCNISRNDRKVLMNLMLQPSPKDIACVYFKVDAEECCQRMSRRTNHPTIMPGTRRDMMRIVGSFRKRLEPPSTDEGFGAVHCVESFQDAEALLRKFGCSLKNDD